MSVIEEKVLLKKYIHIHEETYVKLKYHIIILNINIIV